MFTHIQVGFELSRLPESNTLGLTFANLKPEEIEPFFQWLGTDDGLLSLESTLINALVDNEVLTREEIEEFLSE